MALTWGSLKPIMINVFKLKYLIFIVSLFFSISFSQSETLTTPVDFMDKAITLFAENWEGRDTVDWDAIRAAYLEKAQDLNSTEETYPLIRDLIVNHIDSWSYLEVEMEKKEKPADKTGFRVLLPDWVVVYVFDDSPAQQAGLKVGDRIVRVDGLSLTSTQAKEAPFQPSSGATYQTCRFMNFTYCDLLRQVYTENAQLEVYRQSTKETLVFRIEGQVGNNLMRPTGRALGNVGYLELTVVKTSDDEYKDDVSNIIEQVNETPTCGWIIDLRRHAGGHVPFLYSIFQLTKQPAKDLPIAVLISPITHSSGENTAKRISANGRAKTFGEETGGNHPSMMSYPLDDGVSLVITQTSRSIQPDFEIKNDWTRFQMNDDPVILEAKLWLEQQSACAK